MKILQITDPKKTIQEATDSNTLWMSCSSCDRFFPYSLMKAEDCPLKDCRGSHLGGDIFMWDTFRVAEDPRWPIGTEELKSGQVLPDADSFYQEKLNERLDRLLAEFEKSPEKAQFDGAQKYIRTFLTMMSNCESDLSEWGDWSKHDDELLEGVGTFALLPIWDKTATESDIPRMIQEMRAFFRFGRRTKSIQQSISWDQLMSKEEKHIVIALQEQIKENRLKRRVKTPSMFVAMKPIQKRAKKGSKHHKKKRKK